MKAILTLLPLAALAAAPAVLASPYAVRPLPTGLDGGAMRPTAAAFLGNGRLQWYDGGNTISRFPEAGQITLPAMTLPVTPSATPVPMTAAVCDVDRDGDPDIIRACSWNGNAFKYTIQVFLNNGAGVFTAGSRVDWNNSLPYDEGGHFLRIVPGDFDKNGSVDLAILETYISADWGANPDRWDGKLYIRWNAGNGSFDTVSNVQPNGIPAFSSISAADYDRDGDMDIYCNQYTTYGPDVIIGFPVEKTRSLLFSNNGAGAFAAGNNFPKEMPGEMLDVNNDGWADLSDGLTESLNNGDGTFGPVTNQSPQSDHGYIWADCENDPKPEMVVMDGPALKQGGNLMATLPADVYAVGAADSDGDGDTDFLLRMSNGKYAFVENRELHTVPGAVLTGGKNISGVSSLASADFDLNGRDDLVAVTYSAKKLWFINTKNDGLPADPVFKNTQNEFPLNAVAADFDTDGRPDVAYTLPVAGAVRLARNTSGAPILWPDAAISTALPGASFLAAGNVGVFSGRPDLFTYTPNDGQLRALNQTSGGWSLSNILAPSAVSAMAVGQYNNGAGDEVAAIGGGNGLRRVKGGQLGFGWSPLTTDPWVEPQSTTDAPPYRLVWADADGNGSREVVYIDGAGGLSAWDPATQTATVLIPGPADIRDIAAADWDQDGRTDIIAATGKGLTVFHFQRSRGQWLRSDLHDSDVNGGGYDLVAVMHTDRDGYPDAAAYNRYGRIDFLRNAPNTLRTDLSSQAAGLSVGYGATATALVLPLSTNGRPAQNGAPADPDALVTHCELLIQEALSGPGGSWTPGGIMNATALGGILDKVTLQANGVVIATRSGNGVSDAGSLILNRPLNGPMVPIAPGALVEHSLRVTIPSSVPAHYATRFFITVKVIKGDSADASLVATASGLPTLLTNNHPVLISLRKAGTPLQAWREMNFGGMDAIGDAANEADPDGDGVPNIMEYVMDSDPKSAAGARPLELTPPNGATPALLSLRLSAEYDGKVKLSIQSSTDLQTWTTVNTRTGTGAWSKEPASIASAGGGKTQFTFSAAAGPSPTGKQFFRMMAEELPE